uniref:Oxysterol-binding protein n=1 Tax=Globodera rostochiensis TaxID=31243 RepID=A0A914GTK7_GLORO
MEPDFALYDARTDYDAIYNAQTEDVQQHQNVITHFFNQLLSGKKLRDMILPVHILERRSLLEMYADSFAHPDEFVAADKENSAEKRFLAVLKYYLNSFFPGRRGNIAKKPYNPVLGETFRCRWTLPGTVPSSTTTTAGPFPGSATNQVTFIAEQVSHHPPISAFYVEHQQASVSCTTAIQTNSFFSGLSVGVEMLGKATLKLHRHNETYTITFPKAYGRKLLSTPFFELAGKVELRCEQTNYRAEITFQEAGFTFLGRPAHQLIGTVFKRNSAVMKLKGEWNGIIELGRRTGKGDYNYQHFTDVRAKSSVAKECVAVMEQEATESRKLWRHVTAALFNNNTDVATSAKKRIEQRQRDEAAQRAQMAQTWQPRHFARTGGTWEYLGRRL